MKTTNRLTCSIRLKIANDISLNGYGCETRLQQLAANVNLHDDTLEAMLSFAKKIEPLILPKDYLPNSVLELCRK